MAKKKGSKASAKYEESDQETIEDSVSPHGNTEEINDPDYEFETLIDALYEKRSSLREAALKGLIGSFTGSVLVDLAESKCEALTPLLVASIKKGSPQEVSLASRVMALLAITVGADGSAKDILEEAYPVLTKLAKTASTQSIRIASLELLSLLSFINSTDEESTLDCMDVLWDIAVHSSSASQAQKCGTHVASAEVRAAALTSWNLLLSGMPPQQATQKSGPEELISLSEMFNSDNGSLRLAAGTSVALLHELGASSNIDFDSEDDDYGTESPSEASTSSVSNAEDLLDAVRQLSVNGGGKKRSKKDRLSLKTNFRKILSSIEDGSRVGTTLKLRHGDTLRLKTWAHMVQLGVFRKHLADGFQNHLQDNVFMHQVFEFEPRTVKAPGFRSQAEKRMCQSSNSVSSKARSQARRHERASAMGGSTFYHGCDDGY